MLEHFKDVPYPSASGSTLGAHEEASPLLKFIVEIIRPFNRVRSKMFNISATKPNNYSQLLIILKTPWLVHCTVFSHCLVA